MTTGNAENRQITLWRLAVALFALSGFALAQPLFAVLKSDVTFFVARRSHAIDLLLFVAAVLFVLPVCFTAVVGVAGFAGQKARGFVFSLILFVLIGAIAMPAAKRAFGIESHLLFGLAALCAAPLTWLYWKAEPMRTFVSVLALGPILFAGLFLLNPSVAKVLSSDATRANDLGVKVDTDTSVIFIIFDELPTSTLITPDQEIDAKLFPNFARLAATSTWFRNASTAHSSTYAVVPAALDGTVPDDPDRLPISADHPRSIFHILRNSHRMKVKETITSVCPVEAGVEPESVEPLGSRMRSLADDLSLVYAHIVLPESATEGLPDVTSNWGDFGAPTEPAAKPRRGKKRSKGANVEHLSRKNRTAAIKEFSEYIDDSPEPTLYFLHAVLPHTPWFLTPEGVTYQFESKVWGLAKGSEWRSDRSTLVALQRHMLQMGYTDRLLGDLIDRFESAGVFDRSVVVVMADHGFSFEGGTGKRAISYENQEVLYAPLFVKEPFQDEARIDDRNIQTFDVLPTLLDVLDIEVPWELAGHSALGPFPEPDHKVAYTRWGDELSFPSGLPDPLPGLARKVEAFGPEPDWPDLYAIGSPKGLLSKPVSDLQLAGRLKMKVSIHHRDDFYAVADPTILAPCFVRGRFEPTPESPRFQSVAVELGGVIRAITPAIEDVHGRFRYGTMVPAAAFRVGMNRPRLYGVTEDEEVFRLVPPDDVDYVLEDGRLVRSDGSTLPITASSLGGTVGSAKLDNRFMVLSGWAANVEALQPAEAVILFQADMFLDVTQTGGEPGDASEVARSGFLLKVPRERFAKRGTLEVFAVQDGRAWRLEFAEDARWAQGE